MQTAERFGREGREALIESLVEEEGEDNAET